MKAVLDASVFFSEIPLEGELFTTPSVCDELIDIRAKGNFEKLCAKGLTVLSPAGDSLRAVDRAAEKTRDSSVISGTDRDLLALAKELGAVLYTDDFAIQNVAGVLGVETRPILQRKARQVRWKYRCTGCGRYYSHDGDCPVCGAAIKRKLK
ncbi:nucleotide-binding protein [Methanoregula sp.]|uniref:NOB1 family endonuclease n=1 Tax=Methanoregula sp. TaxID=2052170 RepID=UPI00261BC409|nr:nucleotide-binding protein [Methanoregula sp.]MDD5142521.1 nucleotide-binding protein [Methanoregula sp.]